MEPMSVKDMVADARTRIQGLSKEEMQRELAAGDALIIDNSRMIHGRSGTGSSPTSRLLLKVMVQPEKPL